MLRPWKGAASTSTIPYQSSIVILFIGMFKTRPKVAVSVCTQKDKGTGSTNVGGGNFQRAGRSAV